MRTSKAALSLVATTAFVVATAQSALSAEVSAETIQVRIPSAMRQTLNIAQLQTMAEGVRNAAAAKQGRAITKVEFVDATTKEVFRTLLLTNGKLTSATGK